MRSTPLFLALAIVAPVADAADGDADRGERPLGVGIILGEPTGISARYFLQETYSLDMGVTWSFSGESNFHFHADYLFTLSQDLFDVERLDWYAGVGGRLKLSENEDNLIGVRVPIGLSFWLENERLEFFGEAVPIVDLTPDVDIEVNFGIGARFYF